MRYSTRAMLGMLLATIVATTGVAEEPASPWWHFGMGKSAPETEPSMTAAPTLTPSQTILPPTMGTTVGPTAATPEADDKRWLKWPTLPKWSETTVTEVSSSELSQPKPRRDHFGKPAHRARSRNAWAQPPATATAAAPGPSTWSKVSESTRNAWHKTVDFVTPGEPADTSVANNQPRDSWWHRMWSSNEEAEGPQTVTEWMAQDRLDP
jgi:hypothetical protein